MDALRGRRFIIRISISNRRTFSIKILEIQIIIYFSCSIRLLGVRISRTFLLSIPAFVRFNTVELACSTGTGTKRIKTKCEWIKMILQPIKRALKGAKLEFRGDISDRFCDFTDNSMLLTHIEKELLPIANACRSYKFNIDFFSYHSASEAANTIASILQFGPIAGCSNVSFNLILYKNFPTVLPVDAISNWLNRSRTYDAISANGQAIKERILEIKFDEYIPIHNVSETLNGLKKVNFNYYD